MVQTELISMCKTKLNWKNLHEETVMVIGNDFDMECCFELHASFGIKNLISLGNGIAAKSPKGTVGGHIRLLCADIEIRSNRHGLTVWKLRFHKWLFWSCRSLVDIVTGVWMVQVDGQPWRNDSRRDHRLPAMWSNG
ncbi:uncharacterized protein TNCV_4204071 [Trichonephila clavipes]|nr:uncharacterized protein TNCV_4204071 [Trichonephila clavipes]